MFSAMYRPIFVNWLYFLNLRIKIVILIDSNSNIMQPSSVLESDSKNEYLGYHVKKGMLSVVFFNLQP